MEPVHLREEPFQGTLFDGGLAAAVALDKI